MCKLLCNMYKEPVASHKYAKNWSGLYASMEQDVIVVGFLQSTSMHGLVYCHLIADHNSNVHIQLINAMPYRPTRQVEKIECRNHIFRNYVSQVQDVRNNTKLENL
ncbi:hypothetical protein PR048_011284 [Dryococelus australis]|uniref:Mutator-like transposase domain-containing protein n=1 Tax=Dryococelus australis TaxID=614101 RepID=A0ABQ9HL47_9NEOP|nr:hypothetical protein PR048_011284 [Dryococelus australis]